MSVLAYTHTHTHTHKHTHILALRRQPTSTPLVAKRVSPLCPKCSTFRSGKRSCCARGGAWFRNCGRKKRSGSASAHTWAEGMQACSTLPTFLSRLIILSMSALRCTHARTQTHTRTSISPALSLDSYPGHPPLTVTISIPSNISNEQSRVPVRHLHANRKTQLLRSRWFLVPGMRKCGLRFDSHVGRRHGGLRECVRES